MPKSPNSHSVEEQFLLRSLHRLPTPELRYVFTQLADLVSLGLMAEAKAQKEEKPD